MRPHPRQCRRAVPLVLLLAFSVATAPARPASACAPPECAGGYLVPNAGTVPANLAAFLWLPRAPAFMRATVEPTHIRMFRETAGGSVPVPVTVEPDPSGEHYLVRPVASLDADTSYRLEGANLCASPPAFDEHTTVARFRTQAAAAPPSTLGALAAEPAVVGPLMVSTISGRCTESITAAQAEVALEHTAEAVPWSDALLYTTTVDGRRWRPAASLVAQPGPGESWRGRGRDLVFARCSSDDPAAAQGVAEGRHTVQMTATLPGSTAVVASTTVEVELHCGDAGVDGGVDADVDGGADAAVDVVTADASEDAGPETDATAGEDVGPASDAARGDGATQPPLTLRGGCGCRAARPGRLATLGPLLGVAALLAMRRRRPAP